MTRRTLPILASFALLLAACNDEELVCPAGETACGGRCVSILSNASHCGACGNACGAEDACIAGTCAPDACAGGACDALQVACFSTNDVRGVSADLALIGPARPTDGGPIAIAIQGGAAWVANSLDATLSVVPLASSAEPGRVTLEGSDFEYVAAHEGVLFVANSGGGTVIAWDPVRSRVLDEFVFQGRSDTNPRALAFAGARAFVPLYGKADDETSGGHAIAVIDLSDLAACVTAQGGARPPCGSVEKVIDLRGNAAAFDAPGLPFPSRAAAADAKVYVTLANLKKSADPSFPYFVDPAGPGRLAVIDTARDDALSIVRLEGCFNPGAIAVNGAEAWVACGGGDAPGLLRIDLSGEAPVPEPAIRPVADLGLGAPGSLAFCDGMGYVTDQWSGTVLRFDPAGVASPVTAVVCPHSEGPFGWAWAADVACAR